MPSTGCPSIYCAHSSVDSKSWTVYSAVFMPGLVSIYRGQRGNGSLLRGSTREEASCRLLFTYQFNYKLKLGDI